MISSPLPVCVYSVSLEHEPSLGPDYATGGGSLKPMDRKRFFVSYFACSRLGAVLSRTLMFSLATAETLQEVDCISFASGVGP